MKKNYSRESMYELPDIRVGPIFSKKQVANTIVGGKLNLLENGLNFVDALTDINFSLNDGEILGLVGHNGSGKTSLLRAICGILHPTQGNIHIQGKISCLIEPGAGLDYEATGKENIYLLSYNSGREKSEIKKAFGDIVDFAELGDFLDLPVRTYSMGMIARLAFAVATAYDADIIIMDEGIAAGDTGFMERATGRVRKFLKSAKCVIIATHSKDFVDNQCTRVITLEKGHIVSDKKNPNVILD